MKLRIYLDTSVISALFDEASSERQIMTKLFWEHIDEYEVSISDLTVEELTANSDVIIKEKCVEIIRHFAVVAINGEMLDLARFYITEEVFTATMRDDATHVAAAVLSRQDILLSWNFRHLVNRRRRLQINQLNSVKSLPNIEILSPAELEGGK